MKVIFLADLRNWKIQHNPTTLNTQDVQTQTIFKRKTQLDMTREFSDQTQHDHYSARIRLVYNSCMEVVQYESIFWGNVE